MTPSEKAEDARRNYALALYAMAHRNDLIPETRKRLADEAGGLARESDFHITSITERVIEIPAVVQHEATAEEIQVAERINLASDALPLVPRHPLKTAFHGVSRKETA